MDCEVVRDLLPLYADDARSEKSRTLVEAHLQECAECSALLENIRKTEIEGDLKMEKEIVLSYGAKRFKRRSAAVGSVVSGLFMIPILVCLVVNMATGHGLDWFFVVLASLGVAASLIIVPLIMPENKLLWTFCAFCVSLMVLLAVVCLYAHGSWFWIASSASLFGLSVIFLPFVVKAKPVRKLLEGSSKWLVVLGVDAILFVNMMNIILSRGAVRSRSILMTLGVIAGMGMIVLEILRKRGTKE